MGRAESVRVAYPLFQAGGGGSSPTSALELRVERIGLDDARKLNKLWHSRLPRIGTGSVRNQPYLCWAARFGDLWYAVAIWSPPVARLLPQDWSWLELRRLAVAPDAPRNTPSRMIAVMTRLIRGEMPGVVKLISYQDTEVHTGGIYRAAGWTPTTLNRDGNWDRPNRSRPKAQSEVPKQRWEKVLHAG